MTMVTAWDYPQNPLTDTGLEVFRRIGAQHSNSIVNRMSVLDADELRRITSLSDKLRAGAAPS